MALERHEAGADGSSVKTRRATTLDLIGAEYAEAVAQGNLERAEGWIAVAAFAHGREARRGRSGAPKRTFLRPFARAVRPSAA